MITSVAFILTVLFGIIQCDKDAEEQDNRVYFGMPVGALKLPQYGLEADIYASDERTLNFQNFSYHPEEEECIALIVGPPREYEKKSFKEGVLLEIHEGRISQILPNRRTRQAISSDMFPLSRWPAELDHLEMAPEVLKAPKMEKQSDPFAGIHLDIGQEPGLPKNSKEILIGEPKNVDSVQLLDSTNQTEMGPTEDSKAPSFPDYSDLLLDIETNSTDRNETGNTTEAFIVQMATTTILPTKVNKTKKRVTKIKRKDATGQPKAKVILKTTTARSKTLKDGGKKQPTPMFKLTKKIASERKEIDGTVDTKNAVKHRSKKPAVEKPKLTTRGQRLLKKTNKITSTENLSIQPEMTKERIRITKPAAHEKKNKMEQEHKFAATRQPNMSEVTLLEEDTDEAVIPHLDEDNIDTNDYHLDTAENKKRLQPLLRRLHENPAVTQHTGLIIVNPETGKIYDKDLTEKKKKEKLRQNEAQKVVETLKESRLVEEDNEAPQHIEFAHNEGKDQIESLLTEKFFNDADIVPASTRKTMLDLSQTTGLPKDEEEGTLKLKLVNPKKQQKENPPKVENEIIIDKKFLIPETTDGTANFVLANGAKLTSFKWIGVYDSCEQKAIPALPIKDLDPPRIEKLSSLRHRSHNVTSRRLQVLNCNTVLVPHFTYDSTSAPSSTYFYFGIGHFPDNIETTIRAIVVGEPSGEPLRSFYGEDVLLRLPKTYRTFDVDFLTVYNDDEQRSYGHVVIPSLLVPPCSEEDL